MRGSERLPGIVEKELRADNLEQARARVGEMVGRDTETLSEPEVSRAAVESVAENASDGVVAPMLYGFSLARRVPWRTRRSTPWTRWLATVQRFLRGVRLGFGTARRPRQPGTGPDYGRRRGYSFREPGAGP
jgi:hypothetical protein